jgi:hypothetical protein
MTRLLGIKKIAKSDFGETGGVENNTSTPVPSPLGEIKFIQAL